MKKTKLFQITEVGVIGETTPEKIEKARRAILAITAERTGGKVNGEIIATKENILGDVFLYHELGCSGNFVEVTSFKKEG